MPILLLITDNWISSRERMAENYFMIKSLRKMQPDRVSNPRPPPPEYQSDGPSNWRRRPSVVSTSRLEQLSRYLVSDGQSPDSMVCAPCTDFCCYPSHYYSHIQDTCAVMWELEITVVRTSEVWWAMSSKCAWSSLASAASIAVRSLRYLILPCPYIIWLKICLASKC